MRVNEQRLTKNQSGRLGSSKETRTQGKEIKRTFSTTTRTHCQEKVEASEKAFGYLFASNRKESKIKRAEWKKDMYLCAQRIEEETRNLLLFHFFSSDGGQTATVVVKG